MIPPAGDPAHWLFVVAGGVFALAILIATFRLCVGPTLADRVVALDLIAFQSLGILCTYAIVTQRSALLAVALVAGLVLFLGTAAFAIFIYRREVG